MKQSAFKNFTLFRPRTKYLCKKCGCSYRVYGDTWIETKKSVKAVDGTKAFRVYWLCHSGHKDFRGYSKPVSWKKNLGGDEDTTAGMKSYEDEDAEIEMEYQEMVDYAEKMKRSGSGKLFY